MLPSQVNEIKSLVIHDGIPRCATTAGHPPLSVPGLRGALQCFRFESARSIAGHCESSPKQFSSLGILGGNKTAHARFRPRIDRKSTRLNSSHEWISYAVFCLKK